MDAIVERVQAQIDLEDVYCDVEDVVNKLLMKLLNETNPDVTDAMIKQTIHDCHRGTKNRCIECGQDMGECNPRQLCGKIVCCASLLKDLQQP